MAPELRRLPLAAVLLVLAGCAARPVAPPPVSTAPETPAQAQERRQQASRPTYNLAGYPPAVREGYIDGCESAKGTRYGRKDTARFSNDPQYQMGWNDGNSLCKPK
ncbi:MAG TPA: hypothetical protein VFV90_10960 [Usitatibacter sp.]|jgi:hypothetical protein|nr:hypothetical protein [Usitatibacter sp.]